MEVNAQNIQQLAVYLQQTLSPQNEVRKPAEEFLQSVEGNQNYPVLLLHILQSDGAELNIKVAGSITFKNYVKRNWAVSDEGVDKIHGSDRDAVKTLIIDLMLKSPGPVQKQLSQAIAIIGQQDFPEKWQNLVPDMVTRFASGDFHIINGVLQTAHSIFEKYSVEFKSQKLWEEIKFVLDNFAKPLTELFIQTIDLAGQHANNKDALKVIFGSLSIISKIFYCLNYQDLPEFFEDNMSTWMPRFHDLLTISNPLLVTDDDEPGVLEELRSQICDNIGLYAHKYEEEFQPYMSQFVTAVWNLLLATGNEAKYDLLVSNAIQFLASVADRPHYKNLFEDPAVLGSICEKVIVPNMEMRECDVEMFEDNPEEFIRRDLEGSDVDTRRRAACDLVKGLSRHFEEKITSIFGMYVKTMLDKYNSNPSFWKSKDAAMYLVTSLATRAKTAKHGITQTNELVNLSEFCSAHVIPELSNLSNTAQLPIVKADCIKYVMVFRSQLPPDAVKASLPSLVQLLTSPAVVVHTYAAAAIDKILIMKDADGKALVKSAELAPLAENLLKNLFGAFDQPGSNENEYIMKAVMRSFSALQEAVVPYLAHLLPPLTTKLTQAAKNPTRPHYNHYLFESLSLSIRIVCKSNPAAVQNFEQVLFPVFEEILKTDVQEFVPYVFQIMSLMLELHSTGSVPQQYMALFPFLLVPVLWERPANIHPLVRLIQAFISRGPGQVVEHISGLLGVFQKLIASKNNDHEGFYLLQSMIEHLPANSLTNYLKQVFIVLFQRLTSSKTTKYVKCMLVFFFVFVIKNGGTSLIQMIDSIQPGMFGMVCDSLIVKDGTVQKISGMTEKKISAVGITKLLTETPDLFGGNYSAKFVPLLEALVALFELPEDSSIPDDEHFIEIEDTPGYQTAYSQLIFAGKASSDPVELAGIGDPRQYLIQNLSKLSSSRPGQVPALVQQLPDQARQFLQQYLQQAGVSIQ